MNVNPHLQYLQQQHNQDLQPSQGQVLQLMQQQRQMRQHMLQQNQNQGQNQQNQNQQGQNQQGLGQGLAMPGQNVAGLSLNPLLSVLNGGNAQNGNNSNGTSGFNQNVNPLLQMQLQQLQQQQQQQQQSQQSQQQQQQQQQQAQQQQQPQRPQQQQRFSNPALHQQIPAQALPHPMHLQLPTQQKVPIIKEVWNYNVEFEFNALRNFINDKTAKVYISIHQEIPGIVARPVGTFKTSSDYHFQTLRSNSDLLNIIQLSLCAVKVTNSEISNSVIWQFNFLYDVTKEMYNEEHLSMLALTSQINFASHMSQGIPHFAFAELMMDSGLLLDSSINWLSYHSGYDLGFFISLLTNDLLPSDEVDFSWWVEKYFPSFYDLKHIGTQLLSGGSGGKVNAAALSNSSGNNDNNAIASGQGPDGTNGNNNNNKAAPGSNKPSVEYLAEELHLLPISPVIRQYFTSTPGGPFNGQSQPQQMTSTLHAYLLMECFKELLRQTNFDLEVFEKFKGYIWGLGVNGKAPKNGADFDDASKSKA